MLLLLVPGVGMGGGGAVVVSPNAHIGGWDSRAKRDVPRQYDFGEHYPQLSEADKRRIDDVIAELRPVQKERLAEGLPSKAVRRKIARILPEYATYQPRPFSELMAEAAQAYRSDVHGVNTEEEEALLVLLLLMA